MKTKIFNGKKKIKTRKLSKKDLRNAKEFQEFINSFIKEDAQIMLNEKMSLKEEKQWLAEQLKKIKNQKTVFLIAKNKDIIVGTTSVDLGMWRQNHIGNLGITIRKGYRGMGLGNYLTREIIKLAKKELKPRPKSIRLSVFSANKPAVNLYKKYGFKKVAVIPHQLQYKGKLFSEIIMILYL